MNFTLYNKSLRYRDYWENKLPDRVTEAVDDGENFKAGSFIIINDKEHERIYLGKIKSKRKVTTFQHSLTLTSLVQISLDLENLSKAIHPRKWNSVLRALSYEFPSSARKLIMRSILDANEGVLDKSYFSTTPLKKSFETELFPQFQDSLSTGLSIFGIRDHIPPLTEEQILDFEIGSLFEGIQFDVHPDGKHFIQTGDRLLCIQKVHNTAIERCLGVDLIYNYLDEHRVLFVQYKCLKKNSDKFYKSSDSHFATEMGKMLNIPGVSKCKNMEAENASDMRLCFCPIFIKLCAREIRSHRDKPYGFYYPICIWKHIYDNNSMTISFDDKPKISNDQFVGLAQSGLIGSTHAATDEINRYLVEASKDERLKLIFTESHISENEHGIHEDDSELEGRYRER